jgi:pimeloyl-ACP methyl ester carboxylesterase
VQFAPFRDGWFTSAGIRMHYLDWGDPAAPPIVMLHGTTSNAHSWDAVATVLAPRYRCLALDARNHGLSGDFQGGLGGDVQIVDVLALAEDQELERFGVISLSMGSRAAMGLAGSHPGRVNRLVLEDMAPEIVHETAVRSVRFQQTSPNEFATRDELVAWVRRARRFASDAWIEHTAEHAADRQPDGSYRLRYRVIPGEGRLSVKGPESEALWAVLPNIACPTLILRGGASRMIDDELMARMIAAIPDARGVVVPNAGHMVHEDNPAVAIPLIAEFFGITD